jgi:hypothetical protein
MKITYLPHAKRRMRERKISEDEVRMVLEDPDTVYQGNLGRTVAERTFEGRRLATKVVYNHELEDEFVVVTAEVGRPSVSPREGESQ